MTSATGERICSRCRRPESVVEFGRRMSEGKLVTSSQCRECHRESARATLATIPGQLAHIQRKLLTLYHLELRDFVEFLRRQKNRCAICELPFGPQKGERPHVDHDHKTGETRGLLCGFCNTLLGMSKDDPAVLRRALKYLRDTRN